MPPSLTTTPKSFYIFFFSRGFYFLSHTETGRLLWQMYTTYTKTELQLLLCARLEWSLWWQELLFTRHKHSQLPTCTHENFWTLSYHFQNSKVFHHYLPKMKGFICGQYQAYKFHVNQNVMKILSRLFQDNQSALLFIDYVMLD